MLTQSEIEKCGRKALEVLKEITTEPNDFVLWQALLYRFPEKEDRSKDLNIGLGWCERQGYVKKRNSNNYVYYALTEKMFSS